MVDTCPENQCRYMLLIINHLQGLLRDFFGTACEQAPAKPKLRVRKDPEKASGGWQVANRKYSSIRK